MIELTDLEIFQTMKSMQPLQALSTNRLHDLFFY